MPDSSPRGAPISAVELTNVSVHGFWLLVDGHEWFLAFEHFPWFEDATIRQLAEVVQVAPEHLRWPALDIDISLESVRHPERYPLVSRVPAAVRESAGKTPSSRPRRPKG